jgi:glycosyltransferase involved in cell wall biosynthesis
MQIFDHGTIICTMRTRIGLVVPHIFMQDVLLKDVIFSPGFLARDLAEGLQQLGADVTLYSPGRVTTTVANVNADLSYFEQELAGRGYGYMELLKKHPGTFITLARQVQAGLVARAYADANSGKLDIVHVYTNEEEIALPFAQFCQKPVVFTHHDPFNFLIKYKNLMPKYAHLNWISMSLAQRGGMPEHTNWVGNVYHGLSADLFHANYQPAGGYFAYFGRIIEAKGVHLAIEAVKLCNKRMAAKNQQPVQLRIAGKHYAETSKDTYWHDKIEPHIDGKEIIYEGFIADASSKEAFLGNALATITPSIFDEPFGMVLIESLACGTPVVGLDSGAISEVVKDGTTGFVVPKRYASGELDIATTTANIASALEHTHQLNRHSCRKDFEARFTLTRMCQEHQHIYERLVTGTPQQEVAK